jgi:hypothetical protein
LTFKNLLDAFTLIQDDLLFDEPLASRPPCHGCRPCSAEIHKTDTKLFNNQFFFNHEEEHENFLWLRAASIFKKERKGEP